MNRLWALLGVIVIVFGLSCIETKFGLAQTGTNVNGIIFSDETWTRANSPYTLTGPIAVNKGVTLTIEPGTTVNINTYYIQVNGTLSAKGTSDNMIQIKDGTLQFTSVSVGWNNETSTGCIIQYVNLMNTSISASNPTKLDHDIISGDHTVSVIIGDNSVITNNNILVYVAAGDKSIFIGNQIESSSKTGNASTFLNNTIQGSISAGEATTVTGNRVERSVTCTGNQSRITNNIIGGNVIGGVISNNTISTTHGRATIEGTVVSHNIIKNGTVSASMQITNNVIVSGNYTTDFRVFGGWTTVTENTPAIMGTTAGSPIISGNNITGGGWYKHMFIFSGSSTIVPAIDLSVGNTSIICNNTIIGKSGLAINGTYSSILDNTIIGDVNGSAALAYNNTISGSLNLNSNGSTISNNTVNAIISVNAWSWNITGNTARGIIQNQGNGYILDNYIIGNKGSKSESNSEAVNDETIGINILTSGIIERNVIANNTFGIAVINGTAIISNNTITNNDVGIALKSPTLATTINYNNIQSNNQNIILKIGTTHNIDATYNWWGTSNTQEIDQTIHDYKDDFNLGNVTYSPFLNTANPKTIPNTNMQPITALPTTTPTTTPKATPTSNPETTPAATPTVTPTSTPTHTPTPTLTPTETPLPTQTPNITPTPETSPTIPEFTAWIAIPLIIIVTTVFLALKRRTK